MLKLRTLRFKGIGRFVETQEISFEQLSNLIQVDGQNNNTGGSSGAGKSTVFNALDFLFGLNSISNSALQSRLTEDPIFVEGEFDLDGQPLIVSRGKKLKITLNGEVTTGSSEISEGKLDQILSIPRELFRPMLHKKQREPGFFLSFTPSKTNSFLTDCLGLSSFKNNIEDIDAKISDLSKMISSLTSNIESSKIGLKASQDAIVALGEPPTKDVDQDTILQLKSKMDSAKKDLDLLLSTHQVEKDELNRYRPTNNLIPFDSNNIKRYEDELSSIVSEKHKLELLEQEKLNKLNQLLSDLKMKQSEHNSKIKNGVVAKEKTAKLAAEVLKIRQNLCPTCEQTWSSDNIRSKESQLLEEIKELRNDIASAESAESDLKLNQEQYKDISDKLSINIDFKESDREKELKALISEEKRKESEHVASFNKTNSVANEDFLSREKSLSGRHKIESDSLNGQFELYRRSLETAVMKLKNYDEIKGRYETSLKILKEQEASYLQTISDIELSLNEKTKDVEIAEELKKAIKSYLSCSFDEALEVISENATKIIQNIPNMANATIQLEGTKETKDGKVKEEVNSVIHMDGEENIPIKTLSGGERAAVDIAIDIAVLGLIEERTNKGIDVFILDEPFTGLDSANIEMVLEVLKNANTHKKLIVVDHNPVVKEQISDRITVVRDGLTSKILSSI